MNELTSFFGGQDAKNYNPITPQTPQTPSSIPDIILTGTTMYKNINKMGTIVKRQSLDSGIY